MARILSNRGGPEKRRRYRNGSLFLSLATAFWLAGILAPGAAWAVSGPSTISLADSPSITDWLSVGALWVTAGSVIVAIWQIMISRNTAKRERTRTFQERYQSDAFSESASRTLGCMRARNAGDCVRFVKAWSNRPNAMERVLPRPEGYTKASVQDIELTLTLFEEMGTAYKLKQLDEETIRLSLAPVIIQIFTATWWLICWFREGHLSHEGDHLTGDIYGEFEELCAAVRKDLPTLMDDLHLRPAPEIRALCLPHGSDRGKVRGAALWSASDRLSLALSAFISNADGSRRLGNELAVLAADVEALQPAPADDPPPPKWDVILVPATIDQRNDDEWRTQRHASIRLSRALDRCAERSDLEAAIARLEMAAQAHPTPGSRAAGRTDPQRQTQGL